MREQKIGRYERAKYERRRAATTWVLEYKAANGCASCRNTDPDVLDFHHRDPATKTANVSDLVVKGYSVQRIIAEVALCDLVCANCHRKSHGRTAYLPEEGKPFVPRLRPQPPIGRGRGKGKPPSLCRHKATDRAYATDPTTGRAVYFGRWGTEESVTRYGRWLEGRTWFKEPPDCPLSVGERFLLLMVEAEARAICTLVGNVAGLAKLADRLAELDACRADRFKAQANGREASAETVQAQGHG